MKYKILMALMGLEIGGAETHVVELAKELKQQGFDIVIASNGGVYEKELEDAGIKLYKVPMHRRNLFTIVKSYFMMKHIIKKEKIDIVHSHARIPGFITGLLHKRMQFTFVTSAHWVFYTGMGLKYLTNWGQKVVAVSEDIRQYLMENYKVWNKDIFVTINGIDTEKFSPKTDGSKVRQEFGLDETKPTLVYVSRMDESRAFVARQLIDMAPELAKQIPGLQMLVVGGGDVYDELLAKSAEINKTIGRNCIQMTGGRIDINELIAVGDVFVGVSRAALEAMAAGKTTIVAGNEGYIGLFGKDKLELAQENNFCCRGCAMSTEKLLFQDLDVAFNKMTAEQRTELGQYGREVIFQYYSVSRMALDCVKAYDSAWQQSHTKQYNVVMSGYYGFNNTGDEAIMISMHKNIQNLGDNYNITVLSNKPEETRDKYGIEAVYRFGVKDVFHAVKNCDVLLSGGGSLLQDSTSTRSLMYYLSITAMAKMMGKKVMLYANGIGPVSGKRNRRFVKQVVNKADLITLREENSYEELLSMGVDAKKCFVTADPVFTMEAVPREEAVDLLRKEGIPMDKKLVVVSVRNWKGMGKFIGRFAKLCDLIVKKYDRTIVFLAMQVPNDIHVSEQVKEKMKEDAYILQGHYSPYQVMGIISLADFILSMRLHTLIFAASQKIPLIGFVYDPKIAYYLKKLEMPSGGKLKEFDMERTIKMIEDMIANKEKYVNRLGEKERILEEMAHKNEVYLQQLLQTRKGK
ncbi:polysaccharide pyruvyl transferase CsaB [Chakrabartyella piscis]|uniref:polysaccharide pyruvyl transferase CsaB n=1 Tax=Chakrabartyella piscis TaxID=2918914 RepID=UPI0029586094|nr:polysaccharide pyruvyl transferase CsaB [Chakrabartyella piscis]